MESILFTTLTANEEASLSGGNWGKKHKPVPVKPTPVKPTPVKPTPTTVGPITLTIAPIVTQVAINTNTGDIYKGSLTQTAANVISLKP
ncbi:hypothetical protein PQG02_16885 [Nostoc sp. UHCC 0926]|uniref:hypothetical protein n=1 Tax=unclassified Nostoc TaxID=2593658 RepID=UPI00235E270A|nr:hypothetical protein [Nostoc sp. UHCC 0926]WDD30457.1 hypothetical protein PQG02_16885 [Nostoc sp. UHCC 0926]